MQAEVFHIYHQGEQRGPYTVRQISHWHRCGFIDDETLYWREGMEQWQSISDIVFIKRRRNRIVLWGTICAVVAVFGFFAWLFGPVTAEAWRELTSGEYTEQSAWWRARGLLREHGAGGEILNFDPFQSARIALAPPNVATVELSGILRLPDGRTEHAAWRIRLRYNEGRQFWSFAPRETAMAP